MTALEQLGATAESQLRDAYQAVEQVLPRRSASAVRSQGLSLVRALLADRTVRRMWARPPAEHSSYVVSTQSQVWARTLTDSHLGVRPDQSIGT